MKKNSKTLTSRKKNTEKNPPDKLLIAIILLIAAFGIVMVYSASHYHAMNMNGDPFAFAKKQALVGILGACAMLFVTYKVDYKWFSSLFMAGSVYVVSLLLSLSLFVIGKETKGATRWIELPGGLSFQPSEIVKIGVILFLSAYIVKNRNKMHELKYVAKAMGIILFPAAIIAAENLSSAIVVAAVGFLILFLSTPRIWYYILGVIGVGAFVCYAYFLAMTTDPAVPIQGPASFILKQYRLDRIRVWKDPFIDPTGKGYQPIQSLYAIGSGGLFGKGLGQGVQKLGFLPEPHNDIIFAVICEELGLVGAVLLLLAYTILVLRGFAIASHADDLFGSLVAAGIAGMIGIQVLINVAVNTNTLPTTGMQLPLISYGGTALLILLGSLGILINISRTSRIKKADR